MSATQSARFGRSPSSSSYQNQTQLSSDLGWDAVRKELKEIDHGQAALDSSDVERASRSTTITHSHWKPQDQVSICSNSACKKKFGALDRKLHCRSCGSVFCDACTQFKRKLNLKAQPDPDGTLYRVCEKCFDKGPQVFGRARDWKASFVSAREAGRRLRHQSSLREPTLGSRLGVQDELIRLRRGFSNSASSWLRSTVTELRGPLSVPDWQRSPHWENTKLITVCHVCRTKFGVLSTKHHCKVCGRVLCKACGADDLLLYLDDDTKEVRWALYGLEGCPEKEPSARLYLRCCHMCKEALQQIKAKELDAPQAEGDFMGDIAKVHSELCHLQEKLEKQLPIFQEHIESLSIDKCSPRSGPHGTSPIKQLAKAQMDVSDCITRYGLVLNQQLRRLRPTQKIHTTLLSRIAQSKMLYYRDHLFLFRALKGSLASTTPPEVLELVQNTVELQTITNVFIVMRQLSLEVLRVSEARQLDKELLDTLMTIERNEVCSLDMQAAVERCVQIGQSEDWDEHLKASKELTSMRVREKGTRIVKIHKWPSSLSKSQTEVRLNCRCYEVIAKVHSELEAKSSSRSFTSSKECISLLKAQLETALPRDFSSMSL